MIKYIKQAIALYRERETRKRVDRIMELFEEEKQWKLDQKKLRVQDGLLDPRLDVLINVQSKLHFKAMQTKLPDDVPTLSWDEVNQVIQDEMKLVIIARSQAKL